MLERIPEWLERVYKVCTVCTVAVLLFGVLLHVPALFGYHALPVAVDTKDVPFALYDLVYYSEVDPAKIEQQNLIACSISSDVVAVLRVQEIAMVHETLGFRTSSLFVRRDNVLGRVGSLRIPFGGFAVEFASSKATWVIAVLLCALWTVLKSKKMELK